MMRLRCSERGLFFPSTKHGWSRIRPLSSSASRKQLPCIRGRGRAGDIGSYSSAPVADAGQRTCEARRSAPPRLLSARSLRSGPRCAAAGIRALELTSMRGGNGCRLEICHRSFPCPSRSQSLIYSASTTEYENSPRHAAACLGERTLWRAPSQSHRPL